MDLLFLAYKILIAAASIAFGLMAFWSVLNGQLENFGMLFGVICLSAGIYTAKYTMVDL